MKFVHVVFEIREMCDTDRQTDILYSRCGGNQVGQQQGENVCPKRFLTNNVQFFELLLFVVIEKQLFFN